MNRLRPSIRRSRPRLGGASRLGAAAALAAMAALASGAGCSGGQSQVVPHLPGDGADHTAPPRAGGHGDDPWAGHTLIQPPGPATPHPLSLPQVERFTLRSGLPVLAITSDTAPTFFAQLAIKAGRKDEPRDKVGLANFVASMMTRGVRGMSGDKLTATMEKAGAQLSANASYEATLVTCHGPASGANACLRAVADMASAPSFPAAAINDVRQELDAAARQAHADPGQLANLHFQNALWGEGHVRGWPISEDSIGAITRADLVAWQRAWFSPDNAVLVVVSPEPRAALQRTLERTLGRWRARRRHQAQSSSHAPPALTGLRIRLVDVPGLAQAQIRIGGFGVSHRDPDFFAATVVNQILGGVGGPSRLARALHAAFGDQVAASTSFDRNLERGAFVAAAAAPADKAVAVARTMMAQIGKMSAEGPTDREVAGAVVTLVGGYETRLESPQQIASAVLAAALHGLPPTYVRDFGVELGEVSGQAARASAARWLDGKNLVVVIAGDARRIEPQLKEAGFTYDKLSRTDPVAKYQRDALAKKRAAPVDPRRAAAARALLDAALAAKGGAARLRAVKTFSWKGKAALNLPGGKVQAQVQKRFMAPDRLRLDMTLSMNGQTLTITTVLDGNKGWAQETRGGQSRAMDFPPGEVEAGHGQIWRDQDFVLLRHKEKGTRIEPQDDVNIDGVPQSAVRLTSADGKHSVVLYIDKKSHHLSGMKYTEEGVTAEERYSDYKKEGGLSVARHRTTKSAQTDLDTHVTEVKVNGPVDRSIFVKPATSAPASPAAPVKPPAGTVLPGGAPAPGGKAPHKPGLHGAGLPRPHGTQK